MSSRSDAGRAAAARALDIAQQVQVFGLASAAVVAERYIGTVDRYLAERGGPATTSRPAADTTATQGTAGQEVLMLPAVLAGARSQVSAWVHNPTTAPVPVTVRLSALTSADGHVLPPRAVVVLPRGTAAAWPVDVARGGSCEVRVEVHVPARTPPGHFHGVMTCTATPRQALPVRLEVLPGEGPA